MLVACAFEISLSTSASAATAETTPPATRCITAQTTKMHVNAVAKLEKDVAAYSTVAALKAPITLYRQEIVTAWEAMRQPYCGFGAYGTASAVKSFAKSISRAQSAFTVAVKNVGAKPKMIALTAPKIAAVPTESVVAASKPAGSSTASVLIPRGLVFGMRSSAVAELQRKLATHFSLPTDASYLTGYFGPVTRGLVFKFQIQQKIVFSDQDAGAGQVGPRTAAALNAL